MGYGLAYVEAYVTAPSVGLNGVKALLPYSRSTDKVLVAIDPVGIVACDELEITAWASAAAVSRPAAR